ncbi:MAG: peptidase S10 [Betaproteobacteria bacterium]
MKRDSHAMRFTYFVHGTIAALLLSSCGGGGGGSSTTSTAPVTPPAQVFTDPTVYSSAPNASLTTAAETTAVTQGQITVNGAALNYTATTGHLSARTLTTNVAEASFFYVAYTLNGQNAATRPVTFFYNGGPGSATVWLHLGSFGPKRLVSGHPAVTGGLFPLVDNAESLLDVSDLVFVDAIGSGYSQAITPNNNQTFWGVDADAAVFRDFVMRYVAVNNRAASPKFLYGESYGGPRSGVLAFLLENAGVHLNGVVLQSPAMNYNSNCGVVSGAISCGGFLPSYGATGSWYNLITPNPGTASLPNFMTQMRTFATNDYAPAVRNFLTAGIAPSPSLLTQLSATTGVPVSTWQTRFNLDANTVEASLIPGTRLGRYDSRVSVPNTSPLAVDDPSSTSITPSFSSGIASYLSTTLQYTTPSGYTLLSNAINTWNFSHDGLQVPDTIPDLAAALTLNPRLKVLSLSGYHDLATPFYQTEMDLARLGNNPNVQVRNYIGGHMTYLTDASRMQQKADLVQFYHDALLQ